MSPANAHPPQARLPKKNVTFFFGASTVPVRRGVGQARKRACHLVDSNPRDVGPRQSAAPTSTVLRIVTSGRGGAARGGRRQSLRSPRAWAAGFSPQPTRVSPRAWAAESPQPTPPAPRGFGGIILRTHAFLEFHFRGCAGRRSSVFWCFRSFKD